MNSPITPRPIATDAANNPSRTVAWKVSICAAAISARRPVNSGWDRSTIPIPGTNRNPPAEPLPARPFFMLDFNTWSSFSELECVRTPSLPYRQPEEEDHPSQLPRPTGQPPSTYTTEQVVQLLSHCLLYTSDA